MAWDIARDGETGDLVFTPNRDLMGRDGNDLIEQRIAIRMKIPLGSYIYDIDKRLGSRLYAAMQYPVTRSQREVPEIIREALQDMHDIEVVSIEEPEIFLGQIRTVVKYRPVDGRANDQDEVLETTIAIPLPRGTETLNA